MGGGLAGALSTRDAGRVSRRLVIAGGLAGAGLVGLAVGYGDAAPVTVAGALLMGLLATLALIRLWAVLADAHGPRRAVAMTEGEVAVSLAGMATPLLIGALAVTAATWRLAFGVGAAIAAAGAFTMLRARVPQPRVPAPGRRSPSRMRPTLVIVFAIVALEFALSFWLASYLNDEVGLALSTALPLVSGLYAANLAGRVIASRLARAHAPERVLAGALATVLVGLPFLLGAASTAVAAVGIALAGAGIGALFPLTCSCYRG